MRNRFHLQNSKGNEQGWKQAIEYFERAMQISPDYGAAYAGLSNAWFYRGISGLKANADAIAAVYAALGKEDEAFRILEKAVEERQLIVSLKVDPALENLHSDPRWKELVRGMNFPLD